MIAFFNGQYLPKEEISISPDDRGFLFADGIYEVILCQGGKPFCVQEHLARLSYGALQLHFAECDFAWMEEVIQQLLQKNSLESSDALIYIQVTRGAAPRGHVFPKQEVPLTLYVTVRSFDSRAADDARQKGIAAITVADQRWARCDIKTVGLTANILANQKAYEAGAVEAIFVRDGVLIEGSHSNFAAVRDGELVTFPACNSILNGVTRQKVLSLAASLGIPVVLEPIFQNDLAAYDELMVLATTMKVTPIIQLDGQPVSDGVVGSVVRQLQRGFSSLETTR